MGVTGVQWWSATLNDRMWSCSLVAPGPVQDLNIWVDASTAWGVGILLGGRWDAWRLTDQPRARGQDIGWLEALAMEFIVRTLDVHGLRCSHILVRSDNQGVIGTWQKGRGNNRHVNLSIRCTDLITVDCGMMLSFKYVESAINLADPISGRILPPAELQLNIPISLPDDITPF